MPITLRPATIDDLPFARSLYLGNMREVTERVLTWDEARQTANFDAGFVADEVNIICLDGQDIGWLQVAEREGEIFLEQLFVQPEHQGRGEARACCKI
jgi:hypothetical protein